MPAVTCEQCGEVFTARNSRARFCSGKCRARAHRGATPLAVVASAADVESCGPPGELTSAVEAFLARKDVTETPVGVMAVTLARRLDNSERESGSAVAALSRQLDNVLQRLGVYYASSGSPDPIEMLRERRLRRLTAFLEEDAKRPSLGDDRGGAASAD